MFSRENTAIMFNLFYSISIRKSTIDKIERYRKTTRGTPSAAPAAVKNCFHVKTLHTRTTRMYLNPMRNI